MSEIMNIEMMKLLFLYDKVGVTRHRNESLSSSLTVLKNRRSFTFSVGQAESLKVAKSKEDAGGLGDSGMDGGCE